MGYIPNSVEVATGTASPLGVGAWYGKMGTWNTGQVEVGLMYNSSIRSLGNTMDYLC